MDAITSSTTKLLPKQHGSEMLKGDSRDQGSSDGGLFNILCETVALATQTQGARWNYSGSDFNAMTRLFHHQYDDMCNAVGRLAERLRTKGGRAPFDTAEIQKRISDLGGFQGVPSSPSNVDWIQTLMSNHANIAKSLARSIEQCDRKKDPITRDILTSRKDFHAKALWMLRATWAGAQGALHRNLM